MSFLCCAGQARYGNVDLNTSSLKMYWNVAKQFGVQELWRELLQVRAGGGGLGCVVIGFLLTRE